jgi:hypothetical protein
MGRAILCGSLVAGLLGACGGEVLQQTLLLAVEGEGTVEFTRRGSTGSGVCPPTCTDDLRAEATFDGWDLEATAAEGWDFDHWESDLTMGGNCGGTEASVGLPEGHYACTAVFIPCAATDPEDLALDPDGDATLDIRCITTGNGTLSTSWVRVQMVAPWPPPDVYSWYTKVTVFSEFAELGSYTKELHDGIESVIVSGEVVEADTALVENPGGLPGYAVIFARELRDRIVRVTVETGIQKTTDPATFRMDGPVEAAFDPRLRDPP